MCHKNLKEELYYAQVYIPESKRGKVIGTQGHRIKALKKQTQTKIDNTIWFINNKPCHGFMIRGSQDDVEKAVQKIRNIVDKEY